MQAPIQAKSSDRRGGDVPGHGLGLRGGEARPLPARERGFFEGRFGARFDHVRVHAGPVAAEAAEQLDARAFTLGQDIGFAAGEYAPHSQVGRRLIAHELAHTLQQSRDGAARRVVQRKNFPKSYGHGKDCEDPDLKQIWGGHHLAQNQVDKAWRVLKKGDLTGKDKHVVATLKRFFGSNAADAANLQTIIDTYANMQGKLEEAYMYHCQHDDTEDPCRFGTEAETVRTMFPDAVVTRKDGDIVLCTPKLRAFTRAGAARLFIHETGRRLGFTKSHNMHDSTSGDCDTGGESKGAKEEKRKVGASGFVDRNPSSYACFANVLWGMKTSV